MGKGPRQEIWWVPPQVDRLEITVGRGSGSLVTGMLRTVRQLWVPCNTRVEVATTKKNLKNRKNSLQNLGFRGYASFSLSISLKTIGFSEDSGTLFTYLISGFHGAEPNACKPRALRQYICHV